MKSNLEFNRVVKEDVQQWQKSHAGRHMKTEKRSWLHIDMHGISQALEVPKHVIMRRAHLPARDLRLLDPVLSYPSSILGREHAIVVNLEHIKTIITAQEVFLLDARNPRVAQFVKDLRLRLPSKHSNQASPDGSGCDHNNLEYMHHSEDREGGDTPTMRGSSLLPFEFQALEACLEAACQSLDSEASTLADQAHKALDALTLHVSASNLETVRQIKNRLVLISGRVQRVRDEIEQLLDDDGDMAEMYLTDKLLREQREGSNFSNSLSLHTNGTNNPEELTQIGSPKHLEQPTSLTPVPRQPKRHSPRSPTSRNEEQQKHKDHGHHSSLHSATSPTSKQARDHLKLVTFHLDHTNADSLQRPIHRRISITGSGGKHQDVEELECLLEAYFVLIDGIIHHVASVKEYIDDTEDYVKIMLDDHQNNLLKLNIIMTITCLVISIFIGVTGLFGMNIEIPLFTEGKPQDFWRVVGWGSFASIVFSGLIMGWCKYNHLI